MDNPCRVIANSCDAGNNLKRLQTMKVDRRRMENRNDGANQG